MARKTGAPEDSEIEVTPEMIEAGVRALSELYLSLQESQEYPEIVRIVFEAMMACRR